jgi:hypothetical protein
MLYDDCRMTNCATERKHVTSVQHPNLGLLQEGRNHACPVVANSSLLYHARACQCVYTITIQLAHSENGPTLFVIAAPAAAYMKVNGER